jgi:hypothetical protein
MAEPLLVLAMVLITAGILGMAWIWRQGVAGLDVYG